MTIRSRTALPRGIRGLDSQRMKNITLIRSAAAAGILSLTHCAGTSTPESAPAADTAASTTAPAASSASSGITDPSAAQPTHLSKAAAGVKDGVTTRKDIIRKLGLFYTKGTGVSGQAAATWKFQTTASTAKSWIPGSAFIPGALITYDQSLTVVLDANDVVVSHSFLETSREKTGLGY